MTWPADAGDPAELPLLGEPLPIEFANTRYGMGSSAKDFLVDAHALRGWLRHVEADPPLPTPRADRATAPAVRELRDATRELLDALALGSAIPATPLETVNRCAAGGTYHARLVQDRTGALSLRTVYSGADPLAELLGRIATETIQLAVTDVVPTSVRRCQGPGCTMLFLRDHHRRRWCHPSCGHRARQADYYRRTVRPRVRQERERDT